MLIHDKILYYKKFVHLLKCWRGAWSEKGFTWFNEIGNPWFSEMAL